MHSPLALTEHASQNLAPLILLEPVVGFLKEDLHSFFKPNGFDVQKSAILRLEKKQNMHIVGHNNTGG